MQSVTEGISSTKPRQDVPLYSVWFLNSASIAGILPRACVMKWINGRFLTSEHAISAMCIVCSTQWKLAHCKSSACFEWAKCQSVVIHMKFLHYGTCHLDSAWYGVHAFVQLCVVLWDFLLHAIMMRRKCKD